MQAKKIVTKIDANPLMSKHTNENSLLKVAAYCRVSTDSSDQLESYKAQVAYYTDAIAKNPRWRFVEIYADEGISGTSISKRDNFRRMLKDCKKGKIDMILTKSVARFARNTVDSLKYVRELKAQGVGVFFEEQNLDSLKADSEMFIGLHSVLAQAESENISANVRWGIQQRMRSGTFSFRYNLLGYVKGVDGKPEIEPIGAKTIKLIFNMYLEGSSLDQIKAYLEHNHLLTAKGKEIWSKSIIQNILMNERYAGDMMLQKTFTENCITKKVKRNRGELAKYFIANNHPAIIDRGVYKAVQIEMARRSNKRKIADKAVTEQGKYSGKYALSDLLVCGECGSPYRRRTWTNNGVNRKVWRCLSRVEHGKTYCKESITVDEVKLQRAICKALSNALENRKEILDVIIANASYVLTGNDDSLNVYGIGNKINELSQRIQETVKMQLASGGDSAKFEEVIQEYKEQITVLRQQQEMAQNKVHSSEKTEMEIEKLKQLLQNEKVQFNDYDDVIIRRTIDYIRVMHDKTIIISLKAGLQIEGKLD